MAQLHRLAKTAETIGKYAEKGKQIALKGKLVNRNYEDKSGVKRYVTEVQVLEVMFLG